MGHPPLTLDLQAHRPKGILESIRPVAVSIEG